MHVQASEARGGLNWFSPNQVLTQLSTHAARAAEKLLNKLLFQAPLVAARGARVGLWLE